MEHYFVDPDEAAHDDLSHLDLHCLNIQLFSFLAHLFSKNTLRYFHSPVIVCVMQKL